ncbi:transcriptional repressor [Sphingobacterium oryzagri]|uniref:Transcriptional repressor n=1 Tax=Sphingobacterium oryzagri TaxID=3025669 RepID=A0ABY7WCV7_9SPHI|nr:transcriptional repressor [Sphingobacterium sp. KACC 22765]WDF67028.1 transcriptional repressor [Sphingobacterium sp. KACC 22765]
MSEGKEKVELLLQHSGLRRTQQRIDILSLLMERQKPMTITDLWKQLHKRIDRVTVYRTLNKLISGEVVCRLLDQHGTTFYKLADEPPLYRAHLFCSACKRSIPIDSFVISSNYLEALDQYEIHEVDISIQGKCESCKKRSAHASGQN